MTPFDDDLPEMPEPGSVNERFEALLQMGAVAGPDAGDPLAAFVAELRSAARGPMPLPSADLAAAMVTGSLANKQPTPGPTTWRKRIMNIPKLVSGLSIGAKVMLGAGVAFAATGTAHEVGVLPKPVEHAFAAVTPFSEHHETVVTTDAPPTSTPESSATPTTSGDHHEGDHYEPGTTTPSTSTAGGDHHETPTTRRTEPSTTTTTADHHEPGTTTPTTSPHHEPGPTTTVVHAEPTTTTTRHETQTPQNMSLTCTPVREPNHINCTWSHPSDTTVTGYKLLRTADGEPGRVISSTASGSSATDTNITPGKTYTYMVVATRSDGSTEGHSNTSVVNCCGA